MLDERLRPSFRLLHVLYGVIPIVAGVDKFTNLLTDWTQYLAPWFAAALPFSPGTFMALVGVIEIAAGILTLLRPRIGALVVSAWLVAIALYLITADYFDIAVRDLAMAAGSFVLARMAAAQEAEAHAHARAGTATTARVGVRA